MSQTEADCSLDPMQQPDPEEDEIFASILTLEEQYQAEGHRLGVLDGSRAGRIEGRQFGLEKGFSKAAEMGRLRGRASVWSTRMPLAASDSTDSTRTNGKKAEKETMMVARLSGSERLRKHIERLAELTDPASLETRNSEEAVQEFEERLGGAKAKATLVGKIVGEEGSVRLQEEESYVLADQSSGGRSQPTTRTVAGGEIEDFMGLPHVRASGQ